jgi:hypothetical protein
MSILKVEIFTSFATPGVQKSKSNKLYIPKTINTDNGPFLLQLFLVLEFLELEFRV